MVENIPGVHVSVLSGEEQDGGSGGTPGGSRETLGVGARSTLQLSLYSITERQTLHLVHMMGLPLMSSDQILAVQSPTVRKCSRDVLIIIYNKQKLRHFIL